MHNHPPHCAYMCVRARVCVCVCVFVYMKCVERTRKSPEMGIDVWMLFTAAVHPSTHRPVKDTEHMLPFLAHFAHPRRTAQPDD